MVLGEFGALDLFVEVVKKFYTTQKDDEKQVLHHALLVIQSICTLNLNKNQLLEKTVFVQVCRQIIKNQVSTEENALKLLLSVMAQVAFESIQMAKKVTLNGELLSDIAEICKTYIQSRVWSGRHGGGTRTPTEHGSSCAYGPLLLILTGNKVSLSSSLL